MSICDIKKTKKHLVKKFTGMVGILLLLALVLCSCNTNTESENPVSESNKLEDNASKNIVDDADIEDGFSVLLEDGRLEITDIFRFDGINPDCDNQEGENIVALAIKNLSDIHLKSAEITMKSIDGETIRFMITDLPAGKETIAFSDENSSADADVTFGDILCEAMFDEIASMNADKIYVSVDGIHIILKNLTNTEFNNIDVYCHSNLGDQYFGGVTYKYTINNLPANGTAEIDAVDCILGLAEVVRIAIDE